MRKQTTQAWTKVLVLLTALLSANAAVAHQTQGAGDADVDRADTRIAKLLNETDQQRKLEWHIKIGGKFVFEELERIDDELLSYLKQVGQNPYLLSAQLKLASSSGLNVVTAPDKKLRIYSWDSLNAYKPI